MQGSPSECAHPWPGIQNKSFVLACSPKRGCKSKRSTVVDEKKKKKKRRETEDWKEWIEWEEMSGERRKKE